MRDKIISYSSTLGEIVKQAQEKRAYAFNDLYNELFVNKIYDELTEKSRDIFSALQPDGKANIKNILTGYFKDGSYTEALEGVNQMLINFFENYKANMRNTGMDITSRDNYINRKEKDIKNYQNQLNTYYTFFSSFPKNNDLASDYSFQVLQCCSNMLLNSKLLLDAIEVKDDSITAQLTKLLAAVQNLEILSTFASYRDKRTNIMLDIEKIHKYFVNIFNNSTMSYNKETQEKLLKITEDKIYFLNLVYMAYNKLDLDLFNDLVKLSLDNSKQDLVPDKLLNSKAILTLISYFNDKRVDTMKEAINLFFAETKEDEKYQQLVGAMNAKVQSLTNELNTAKKEMKQRTESMEDAYESLRKKHNALVEESGKIVDKQNELINKQKEIIKKHNEMVDAHNDMVDHINNGY